MNLLHRLWSRPSSTPPARPVAPGEAGHHGDARCLGCGWFDSSHELQTGLCVSEHDDDAVVAAALPLSTWLDRQLAGWQAGGQVEMH
jgi:hypothetical protein